MVRRNTARGLIFFLVLLAVFSGCLDLSLLSHAGNGSPADVLPAGSPDLSRTATPARDDPVATNMSLVREIVQDFRANHTYNAATMYVCTQMSEDLWSVLESRGINASICVGNIHENMTGLRDANHAWVLAQVGPETWVAIEATGGFLVCPDSRFCSMNNPRYYQGYAFTSPAELEDAMEKLRHPCPDGYVFGEDRLCHPACGSGYCANGSFCVSGQCRKCAAGYVVGDDLRCHRECPAGSGIYCRTGS